MSGRRVARLVPLLAIVVVAGIAAAVAREPPGHLAPELAWCAPDHAHPLGCGEAGVDLVPLLANAVLRGVVLAAVVALVGFAIGTPLGAAAAFARGRLEAAVERTCDLLQAFPTFLLALAVLSAVRAPTRVHLAFVFAITAWAPFARLALAETRVLRSAAFVEAAIALGLTRRAVLFRHLFPNVLGTVAVQLGATGAAIVVGEAALSFVGFGPADGVSLGNVLDQGVAAMLRAPHVLVAGAASVFLTSAAMLVAGRALVK